MPCYLDIDAPATRTGYCRHCRANVTVGVQNLGADDEFGRQYLPTDVCVECLGPVEAVIEEESTEDL